MNGYFQVLVSDRGTALHLIPPTNGGEAIDVIEVKEYLDGKNIEFDLVALNQAVKSGEEKKIVLNQKKEYPIAEVMNLRVRDDKMACIARFYPPSNQGNTLSRDSIISSMKLQGIKFGIDENEISEFLKKRQYCTDYIFAKGVPARQGTDASIEYHFNTERKGKPALKEDGSVDFFNLGIIEECTKGQVLATLTPADFGEFGDDVLGNRIKPRNVKTLKLEFGKNVTLSEDRLTITADCDGQVSLAGGKVHVANVLELKEVGTETGNIEFNGSVRVKGNVSANFSVKAEGNVEVNGIVESAYIEAGGDIIIARGMNGMGKGTLKAGGNIVVKYLENVICSAGGTVSAEAIMQSTVSAKREVLVTGRKGFITGGLVTAGNKIEAKTLGSEMGSTTCVEVGVDPVVKRRLSELQKQMGEAQKIVKQTTPMIQALNQKIKMGIKLQPEQVKNFQTIIETNRKSQTLLEEGMEEMCHLEEEASGTDNAHIIITGEVFPGVKISISGATTTVKTPYKFSRFIKEGGDVKCINV